MFGKRRVTATLLAGMLGLGSLTLAGAKPAEASRRSERLWRYGTYLGALGTGAALLKNKDTWALVGAGVTAYSYSRWRKDVRGRHRAERYARARALAASRARRARAYSASRYRRSRAYSASRYRRVRTTKRYRRYSSLAPMPVQGMSFGTPRPVQMADRRLGQETHGVCMPQKQEKIAVTGYKLPFVG